MNIMQLILSCKMYACILFIYLFIYCHFREREREREGFVVYFFISSNERGGNIVM